MASLGSTLKGWIEPGSPDTRPAGGHAQPNHLFNYRRIWKLAVLLTGGVSLIPLIFITLLDYQVTQRSIESELDLRTTRIVSNTKQAISFFPHGEEGRAPVHRSRQHLRGPERPGPAGDDTREPEQEFFRRVRGSRGDRPPGVPEELRRPL